MPHKTGEQSARMIRVTLNPEVLRWARERAGRTVQDLAAPFPKLARWERGDERPTLKQVERFAVPTTIHETKMEVKLGNTFWGMCTLMNPLDWSQNSTAILQAASRADLPN
jgi:hypothetical protein